VLAVEMQMTRQQWLMQQMLMRVSFFPEYEDRSGSEDGSFRVTKRRRGRKKLF